MMIRTPKLSILLAGLCALALCAPVHASGGDDDTDDIFASLNMVMPNRLAAYAGGNLGIVRGSYWRVYQFMAYRAATGHPLTPQQVAALSLERWHVGGADETPGGDTHDYNAEWIAARSPVAKQLGLREVTYIDVMAETTDLPYLNCHPDAFRQAAAELKARAGNGPWLKAWLQGQDAVFANCSRRKGEPVTLPAEPAANAPAWLKADAAYQAAAAYFYGRQFDQARTRFQAIAADAQSPWRKVAGYLAVRCLIRSATLDFQAKDGQPPSPEIKRRLLQARGELAALAPTYAPARQLVPLVDARLDPLGRLQQLGAKLATAPLDAEAIHDLQDYLSISDHLPRKQLLGATDPLTAWIAAMQATVPDEMYGTAGADQEAQRREAVQKAHQHLQKGETVWLAPLLENASTKELTKEDRKLAAALPPSHPFYLTVRYKLLTAMIDDHELEAADREIDRLFAERGKSMSLATINRLLDEKLVTAGTRAAFVKAALRTPEAQEGQADAAPLLAPGFLDLILRYMPLSEMKTLLAEPGFPKEARARLEEVMMARALVLHDEPIALALLDDLAKPRATTAHLYARYRNAKPGTDRELAGILLLVNTPEFAPVPVDAKGISHEWGCAGWTAGDASGWVPRYLSAAQLARAADEQKVLAKLPRRSDYLGPPLIAWAKQKPNDDEAPKALHFLVGSTRNECSYASEDPRKPLGVSREAFNVLHKNYPNSSWAKATKYYY